MKEDEEASSLRITMDRGLHYGAFVVTSVSKNFMARLFVHGHGDLGGICESQVTFNWGSK